ncbi:MAG: NAD-dependent epimerase/dehydratase family protein [Geminicoccaceae bacterium]
MASSFEKLVCTGGSGRLGRHVVGLLRDSCRLTVLDAAPPTETDAFVQADVTDIGALRRAFAGQDAVVHLAAIPNPRTAPPEVTFRTNVEGTFAVLQAAEEAGVRRVVVASSDSVVGFHYDPPDWKPHYLPIDERHPLCPTEFYSLSKQVTETICRSYAERGRLEVVVIRPTHIVFPPEYPEIEARGSDLMNYHLWTYVAPEDVARAFQLALALPEVRFESFFISAADGLNARPTLELVRERYGFLPEIRRPELYERLPTASVLDGSRAREVLGFAPSRDWRQMLASAAALDA